MTTLELPRPVHAPATETGRPSLPAAGPAWFGAAMGTGILATLSQTVRPTALAESADVLARAMLVTGWLILLGLSAVFAVRVGRRPAVWRESWRGLSTIPLWGMVSMGLLAVGAATATVVPAWAPQYTDVAWHADEALWILATGLGLVTAFGCGAALIRRPGESPTTVWGLAVVPPMVSATVGAGLLGRVDQPTHRLELIVVLLACFFLGLFLAGVIFTVCYLHHWRVERLPIAASATAWIPLGVVGQSTAAAQSIAGHAAPLLSPAAGHAAHRLADGFGVAMLTIGVPLVGWAVAMTARGFRARMPFAPGWWALTFPVGTLALGSHLLGQSLGSHPVVVVGQVCWLTLCGTWTLCAAATVTSVGRQVRR